MPLLNATHDPKRRSWVQSANDGKTDFPIQNLPVGLFRYGNQAARGGVAIGDRIFDLRVAMDAGLFAGDALEAARAACETVLNSLLRLGNGPMSALRTRLSDLLREDGPERSRVEAIAGHLLVAMKDAELLMPATITQFTDMNLSTFHSGRRRGKDDNGNPIMRPDAMWLPAGYTGRASSVAVSGTPLTRPKGQWRSLGEEERTDPEYGPEPHLDYELELGMWVAGAGNEPSRPIAIADAAEHIFGFNLVNDWSARRIQRWETPPLGPFVSKSMGTTISPWIVTAEALAPFRAPAFSRPADKPPPLPYLHCAEDQQHGGLDIVMEAFLLTQNMRASGAPPHVICSSNAKYLYWTWAQVLAHLTSNGCSYGAGDLIGSGTCSGPAITEAACLSEINRRGTEAWILPNGETRMYFEDGDQVILRARAARAGWVSIGFGECSCRVAPASA